MSEQFRSVPVRVPVRSRTWWQVVMALLTGLLSASALVFVLAAPASAAITQPGNGATVTGQITISETACGSGSCNGGSIYGGCGGAYTNINVYNSSGQDVASYGNSGGPLTVTWTTESVPNGSYRIVGDWTYTAGQGIYGCRMSGVNQDSVYVTVANFADIANVGATSAPWGSTVTVSARLTDPNLGNAPVKNAPISFSLGGISTSASTNSNGVATASLAVPGKTGTVTLTEEFPGTAYYSPTSLTLPFDVTTHPTSLTYTGPTSTGYGDSVDLSAKLVDATTGDPVQGATVGFAVAGQDLRASTGSDGVAVVVTTLAPGGGPGNYTLSLSYAGNSLLSSSSATVPFSIEPAPTTLSTTGPRSSPWGRPVTLSALLSNAQTGAPLAGEVVAFSLAGVTATAVTNSAGSASVTMTPRPSSGPGNYILAVSFSGTRDRAASSASVSFHLAWPYHFVDSSGQGTVEICPGTDQFRLEAPSSNPTEVLGPVSDPEMSVVPVTPTTTVIEISYASSAIVLDGAFVEQSGTFAATADTGSRIYVLKNLGVLP